MIEVLVTLVITAVGLLGLNSLQLQANRATADSGSRSQAAWILEDMANRIRANSVALADYSTGTEPDFLAPEPDGNGGFVDVPNPKAGQLKTVDCTVSPAKLCSSYYYQGARSAGDASCTTKDQALYDLMEVACTKRENSNDEYTFRDAIDYIADPKLSVAVAADRSVQMTLSWDVRSGGTDANGNKIYTGKSTGITQRRDSLTTVIQP